MDSNKIQDCAITPITSKCTKFYADSVEWCPVKPFQDFLVCGTYQLDDESVKSSEHNQVRKGDITVYQLCKEADISKEYSLELKTSIETSGVLDMKWAPRFIDEKCTVGVAFSTGLVQLAQISVSEENRVELINYGEINITPECKSLALSLDWASWKHESTPLHIIVSDSSGDLNLINFSSDGMGLQKKWKAHDFEAWIASFDYDNVNMIYSGGDDCLLKFWDLRTSLASPVLVNKSHTMGVTSLLKSKNNEHLLASGSYDEYLRLWDIRRMKSPIYDVDVEGGVWRIKWHPFSTSHIVVAAMHGGFHVLQLDTASGTDVIASYREHESLAYGVDWCWSECESLSKEEQNQFLHQSDKINEPTNSIQQGRKNIVASCSFYDKSLHLWSVVLPYLT